MPHDDDPLDRLDPDSRRARPGVRLGVGAAVVLLVAAVGVAAWISASATGGGAQGVLPDSPASTAGSIEEPEVAPLLVHVLGAVARPGLVELAAGARVVDAVAAAGGLTADADAGGVNLARPVADGEQLRVPRVGEVTPEAAAADSGVGALVNVNTAGVTELDTLPRIGPALAQRIVDYRDRNGPFTSLEQLGDVSGIGDAVLAGLAGLVGL